jgi:hypothetical protein
MQEQPSHLIIQGSAILVALMLKATAAGAAEPAIPVFEDAPLISRHEPPPYPSSRARLARLGALFLDGLEKNSSRAFQFNLFPGADYQVQLEPGRLEGGRGRLFTGAVWGVEESQVLLVRRGEALAGTLFIPGEGSFRFWPDHDDVYWIEEVDSSEPLHCGSCDPRGEVTAPFDFEPGMAEFEQEEWFPPAIGEEWEPGEFEEPEVIRHVEVMVVYTARSRQGVGSTEGMEALIELAMAEANLVLANSEVPVRLRLVHTGEVSYEESGDLDLDLRRLRFRNDGYLDEVHEWRDQYQADLVSLWVDTSNRHSGLAYLTLLSDFGFSVLVRRLAVGQYLFIHELGHNFGCDHDRESTTGHGKYSYSHGRRFSSEGVLYRTVMCHAPGRVIPYFSNPRVLFQGVPTGIEAGEPGEADNARTIRENAATVDNYRGVVVSLTQPGDDITILEGESLELMAEVLTDEEEVVSVEFLLNGKFLGETTVPPYQWEWPDPAPGRHFLSARTWVESGLSRTSPHRVVSVRPFNDQFENRLSLVGSIVSGSAILYAAGLEPEEPVHFPGALASAWFSWTAPFAGTARLSVLPTGTADAARIAIYTGASLPELQLVTRTEHGIGNVQFQAVEDETYQIALTARPGLFPTSFTLTMSPPPPNDQFAQATPVRLIGNSTVIQGSTLGATREPGEPQIGAFPFGHSIWFSFTPAQQGVLRIIKTSTGFAAGQAADFELFSGVDVSSLTRVATSAEMSGGILIVPETTYFIGIDGQYGQVTLHLSFLSPPSNDHFNRATFLSTLPPQIMIMNLAASREPDEPVHGPLEGNRSLWWRWTAPRDGHLVYSYSTFGHQSAQIPFEVGIYTGKSLTNITRVGGALFSGPAGQAETFPVTGNTTYSLAVDSLEPLPGPGVPLRLEFKAPPINNEFQRRHLRTIPATATGWSLGAAAEEGEPPHAGDPAKHSTWWSWRALQDGQVAAFINGTGREIPRLAVYQGDSLASLTLVADNLFGDQRGPAVVFEVQEGQTYEIAVDEDAGGPEYFLELRYLAPPVNDHFARSQPLSGGILPAGSNLGAAHEEGEPDHSGMGSTSSVWYHWRATSSQRATVLAFGLPPGGSPFPSPLPRPGPPIPDPFIAVYTGSSLPELQAVASGVGGASFQPRANELYRIAVDGIAGYSCNFRLQVATTPVNENFATPLFLQENGVISFSFFSLKAAAREPDEPDHAGRSAGHSLWWRWTPSVSGLYTLRPGLLPPGSEVNYTLAVYTGSKLSDLELVASQVNGGVTFFAEANTEYSIAVDLDREARPPVQHPIQFHGSLALRFSKAAGFLPPTIRPDGSIIFRVHGTTGARFLLQNSSDLAHWNVLSTITISGSEFQFHLPPGLLSARQFYRIIPLP